MKAIVVFWILISLSFLEATLPGPDPLTTEQENMMMDFIEKDSVNEFKFMVEKGPIRPDINDGLFLNKGTGGYCQLFFAVYRLAPTLHWQVPFCCEHRGIPPTRESSFGSERC